MRTEAFGASVIVASSGIIKVCYLGTTVAHAAAGPAASGFAAILARN